MSKITLEDCAQEMDGHWVMRSRDYPRGIALIRAAQRVVDAARDWKNHAQWCPVQYEPLQTCTCGLHACLEAIDVFHELEEGE